MRVLVASTAGAGHFGPLVPFAQALLHAEHEVRVAAPASFQPVVERNGLLHAPFADAPREALDAVFARVAQLPRREANAMVVREVFGRIDTRAALPGVRAIVEEWRPDLILREPAEMASYVVAEELAIPHVQAAIGLASLDAFFLSVVDKPMREFDCATGADGIRAATRLTLVPRAFDTEQSDPGNTHRFRYADAPSDSAPLPPWWKDRSLPLVYVTFGSVAAGIGSFQDLYPGVVSALAEIPVRALLTVGDAGDVEALKPLPANVHVEHWWPQQDVMPYASAVIGHGGFGTTMHGLAAGVPLVVMPLFSSDQFLNAARVQEVGAGLAIEGAQQALPLLPDALRRLLSEPSYAAAAGAIAEEMAALPPPSDAVPLLEQAALKP